MDHEAIKRRQSLKVIISEVIMVIAVIVTVIVLALIVSGYWLGSGFKVERQGMLQISSIPTGADVIIDGESSWLQRTNTSKVLPTGEHVATLKREGYDSWTKTINISEGLLYRIHYPRLFLLERTTTPITDTIGTTKVFVSPSHDTMLLYSGDPAVLDTSVYSVLPKEQNSAFTTDPVPNWLSINLDADTPEVKPVTLSMLYEHFKKPEPSKKETVKDFNPNLKISESEKLFFSKFYEDRYLTTLNNDVVTVYKKEYDEPVLKVTLEFVPEITHAGHDGEFMIFSNKSRIATLDMETMSVGYWNTDAESYDWLDNDMIYSVSAGELYVYDYDGLNRRIIAHDVSSRFPVILTRDKWLYYFSDDNLIREQITE